MTDHTLHAEDAHAHEDHGGIGKYIAVFVALCILTAMSFWTYADFPVPWPFHGQPAVGRAFMMAVSCTKAMLVILFFMHVKYEANWKYVLTIPCAMMSIFLILALVPDIGLRGHWSSEERLLYMAEPRGTRKPVVRHGDTRPAAESTTPATSGH